MKNIDENSFITNDGMIWLQVVNRETAIDIYSRNTFELYIINLLDDSERLPEEEEEINKTFDLNSTDEIICIPVGKLERIAPNVFRNNF